MYFCLSFTIFIASVNFDIFIAIVNFDIFIAIVNFDIFIGFVSACLSTEEIFFDVILEKVVKPSKRRNFPKSFWKFLKSPSVPRHNSRNSRNLLLSSKKKSLPVCWHFNLCNGLWRQFQGTCPLICSSKIPGKLFVTRIMGIVFQIFEKIVYLHIN